MNLLNNELYEKAAWVCVTGIAASIAWQIFQGDWSGVAVLTVFLVAAIGFILQRQRLPSLFSFLFAFAALMNAAGWQSVFKLYDKIPGYDAASHAFTSFSAALAVGFVILHSTKTHFREHRLSYAVSIAAFGLALGALWEIYEWTVGIQQTYRAVVVDLIMDAVGSLMAGGLAAWIVHSRPADRL